MLRDKCLPALARKARYCSIRAVRECLRKHGCSVPPDTLKKYLYDIRKTGILFDAGYGWYSTLPEAFVLNTESVRELALLLERQYPLLEFSVWSTGQIKGFTHDTLTRFVEFVYVERHNISPIAERLIDAGYFVYANPRGRQRQEFTIRQKTVVIRPRVTTQPREGHFVAIEGLLVDLFVESRGLPIMGLAECRTVLENLARRYRISIAGLASYPQHQKPATDDTLKSVKSTFLGF